MSASSEEVGTGSGSERAYTELSERENGSPAPAWWEDAIFEDPAGLGVRWNPGAARIPWRQRFEQARLALCLAVGDTVTVESDGVLTLGRVEAFDSSVRVSRRTVWGGLPVELRRIGVEVRFPDASVVTVDAADCRAAGWQAEASCAPEGPVSSGSLKPGAS